MQASSGLQSAAVMFDSLCTRLRNGLQIDSGLSSASLPQAAVLILLELHEGQVHVVLTQRAPHMRLHAGEVAFPGGQCDASDADHWATALREAGEEIALPAGRVSRLGVMAPLVTRSRIEVVPCVGRLQQATEFVANPQELSTVFRVPLLFFAEPGRLQFDRAEYAGVVRRVPGYQWQQYRIWGVTAAMLVVLVNLACAANLDLDGYFQGR